MIELPQIGTADQRAETEIGSYFVANYPPFSVWRPEHVPAALDVLERPAVHGPDARATADAPPLGLYLHVPFCRKRCKFCYFRVYTDKNAEDVDVYCDALAREVALYAGRSHLAGRQFEFVYFGGGTPSFLSSAQLERLIARIAEHWTWEAAREVTFECEPGTLKKGKLKTIKSIGVTRLSIGVEHFDDEVLSINGRAHKSPEIFRSYEWAREIGFDQINIDLIAGMVGETDARWRDAVEKALALSPDSVTIYQMELPHNTVISREARRGDAATPVADWPTKRRWVDEAFRRFEAAGYAVSSGYTLVRRTPRAGPSRAPAERRHASGAPGPGQFVYRDAVWHGADMVGTGVASFSHVGGVHYQNADGWEDYVRTLRRGELPIVRALPLTDGQRLTRELILQLKLGRIDAGYFRNKFNVEIVECFGDALASLERDGFAAVDGDRVELSRDGLLRVDALLPRFFDPEFREIRYT